MAFFQAVFKIVEEKSCPLYQPGDEFKLSGNALLLSQDKPVCLVLAGDITQILIKSKSSDKAEDRTPTGHSMTCSGCSGTVRLNYIHEKSVPDTHAEKTDKEEMVNLLKNFSMFQTLSESDIRELMSLLKVKKSHPTEIIIRKGEPGKNLFIVVTGRVEVMGDDSISIATLEKGDVFGEMSLLSGDPVGATIKVVQPTTLLYISGRDFRNVLNKYPSLHIYFAKLLAKRLAKTNVARAEEFSSGMVGRLSEITPSELFQTFNVNQKTGVLSLNLSKGPAEVYFREGNLIRASYGNRVDNEAFFDILKEKDGRFKFTSGLSPEDSKAPLIGDFMWLLMEGLRIIDEETGNNKDE